MDSTIGFIGLGAMGLPLVRRLADAGCRLVVHDADPSAFAGVDLERASVGEGVRGVCERVEVLMTCLPDPGAVEAVYAEVDREGLLACDCSTVGPGLATRLHEDLAGRGVRYVECPMLGGVPEAAEGRLFLILSGAEEDVERLKPILAIIGRGHRYVGGPGNASRFKVVQNGLGLVQLAAIAEALSILARSGADLKLWCEVVAEGHGMADTPLFRAKAPLMLETSPPAIGRLRIGAKDIALARTLAEELALDTPLFEQARRAFAAAMAAGLGEAEIAEVVRVAEARAGVVLGDG